jgi:hypothetical protein
MQHDELAHRRHGDHEGIGTPHLFDIHQRLCTANLNIVNYVWYSASVARPFWALFRKEPTSLLNYSFHVIDVT